MANIKVLSTHAVQEVLNELGPLFERASGCQPVDRLRSCQSGQTQIENGAAFDVAIVTRPVIDELARQGKLRRETRTDIGRSGLGVAVRKGAPNRTSTTVEPSSARCSPRTRSCAPRKAPAASISRHCSIASASPTPCAARSVLGPSGRIAELVARGEADMAVQQIPELLPVKGAQYVGPLPPELQLYTVFAAGVGSATKDR